MNHVVVLQARIGSSRLPAKSLLSIHGFPLAILAAKRAASTGHEVILATSDDPVDDPLAESALDYGVKCFRGSLDDVLGRFVAALRQYDGSTIVSRLTADNVIPDGTLIDAVQSEFLARDLGYLSTGGPKSGLPYGVSVEMMRLACLREADRRTNDAWDREHVTPFVIRKHGMTVLSGYRDMAMERYRATIDCLDDAVSVLGLFGRGENPIDVSWRQLVDRLPGAWMQPTADRPVSDLVLGTAQLGGLSYGVANRSRISSEYGKQMIKRAIVNGVSCLDTASGYGSSEQLIGGILAGGWAGRCKVVTKLSSLNELASGANEGEVRATVESGVWKSCLMLKQERLDTLLLHRAEHLSAWDGLVWDHLQFLKEKGWIERLGVSVQSPEELLAVLGRPGIDHIQLPFNILDHRWNRCIEKLVDFRKSNNVVIHIRSALLQGLLTTRSNAAWRNAYINDHQAIFRWLIQMVEKLERDSIVDLCLAWVRAQKWADGIVLGMDDLNQLDENIQFFTRPVLTADQVKYVQETRPMLETCTLDPSDWKVDPQ